MEQSYVGIRFKSRPAAKRQREFGDWTMTFRPPALDPLDQACQPFTRFGGAAADHAADAYTAHRLLQAFVTCNA